MRRGVAANVALGALTFPFHRTIGQYTEFVSILPAIVYVGLRAGWSLGALVEVAR